MAGRHDDALERSQMGTKLRRLRHEAGLTLEELAGRARVSTSLISQIERGVAEPSLGTLRGVAAALGIPVAAMFVGDEGEDGPPPGAAPAPVVRRAARKHLRMPGSDVTYELLSPDLNREMEVFFADLPGGARVPAEPSQHPGEETIVVLTGAVIAVQGDEEWTLRAGDTISWDPDRPHWLENRGKRKATVIAVITPPNF